MNKKTILICENCLSRNYSYDASANRVEKIKVKKFCNKCNKHTLHVETR